MRASHTVDDVLRRELLEHDAARTRRARSADVGRVRLSGEHDRRHVDSLRRERPKHSQPVELGHVQVEQQNVRPM
jgi:hypothetical protein